MCISIYSNSISLIKKTHFHPLCPWGLYKDLEKQQTEPLSISHTTYLLSLVSSCLSSLHILSHGPSLISHLFTLCLSPVSVPSSFIFCPSLAVTYFSFSTVYFSHIPATSSVACHHPGAHSSSLNHLLNHSLCDILGPWCCSSLLLFPQFPRVHKQKQKLMHGCQLNNMLRMLKNMLSQKKKSQHKMTLEIIRQYYIYIYYECLRFIHNLCCHLSSRWVIFLFSTTIMPHCVFKTVTERIWGFVIMLLLQLDCDVYGTIYITSRCAHHLFLARGMLCLILFPRFGLREAFHHRGWDGKVSTWSSKRLQHRLSHCCVIRF